VQETKVLVPEKLSVPSLGSIANEATSEVLDWAIVVKRGKRVSLPGFSPPLSSYSVQVRGAYVSDIKGKELNPLMLLGLTWVVKKGSNFITVWDLAWMWIFIIGRSPFFVSR
jgi:hypothetical protein